MIISNNWYTEYITPKSMVSSNCRTHPAGMVNTACIDDGGSFSVNTSAVAWFCSLQEMSLLAAFPILCFCSLNINFIKQTVRKRNENKQKRLHNKSVIGKQCEIFLFQFQFYFSLNWWIIASQYCDGFCHASVSQSAAGTHSPPPCSASLPISSL